MPPFPGRTHRALPLLALGFAATAGAPAGAATPVPYALDTTGAPASLVTPLGLSPDGREVLFNAVATPDGGSSEALIRNVRAGRTGRLNLPGFPAGQGDAAGASTNLRRLRFVSSRGLDPADANALPDAYVFDRSTGKLTLASRSPATGLALGIGSGRDVGPPLIGGDGGAVLYSDTTNAAAFRTLRYDLGTGKVTVAGRGALVRHATTDHAARVAITSAGATVQGRTYPVPPNPGHYHDLRRFVASPDGSAVAFTSPESLPGAVGVLALATGTRKDISTATFPYGTLLAVANGGGSVIEAADVPRGSAGLPYEVVFRATAPGSAVQIGPDLPYAGGANRSVITEDAAFLANATDLTSF